MVSKSLERSFRTVKKKTTNDESIDKIVEQQLDEAFQKLDH
ncbi:hypothetical protein KP78_19190 [Jeotgalibacillus soli]|uniref:Uncharacterized protein n=1 Tax=Jeotgalibacillus soli TaxID=889306 RepID=A0A0C2VQS4_9BACL|nr:hypothetical protein KP78_19190 [Jeotgalibacillus soli]